MKGDLSQEIHGNMIFSVYMDKCCKYITLLPKKQRKSSLEKIHLKVIDILDWHSRKSYNGSLYCSVCMETFIGVFIYLLRSSEKRKRKET